MTALSQPRAPATPTRRPGFVARLLAPGRTRVGAGLMLAMMILAFAGPWFAPHDPAELIGIPFDGPQSGSPLGLDALGRDVLSRVLAGGQSLVSMSLSATLFGVALGTAMGLVAAFRGGRADEAIMRVVDVQLAFPSIVFALLIVTMFGTNEALLIGLVGLSQSRAMLESG